MESNQLIEEWRVIKDFPDYAVSNLGKVKRARDNGNNRFAGDIIKSRRNKKGYVYLTLCHGEIKKSLKVHRLVLEAFIGSCPVGCECSHKDNNQTNNCLSNLEWATHSKNILNSFQAGSKKSLKSSEHGRSKLKEQDVVEIRKMISCGIPQKDIATQFNVHINTIGRIKNKNNWSHI